MRRHNSCASHSQVCRALCQCVSMVIRRLSVDVLRCLFLFFQNLVPDERIRVIPLWRYRLCLEDVAAVTSI